MVNMKTGVYNTGTTQAQYICCIVESQIEF